MIRVEVGLVVEASPVRELWHGFVVPSVPRIGEAITVLDGWSMAKVTDVQWDMHRGEVDVIARFLCSPKDIEELIAAGWSAIPLPRRRT